MLLPKAPDFGDAIILRGKLKPDAKKCVRRKGIRLELFYIYRISSARIWCYRFSFNLCVDVCPCPEVVAFHFKTMLDSNTIVHNHKAITWQKETVLANKWVDGPGMIETICIRTDPILRCVSVFVFVCY